MSILALLGVSMDSGAPENINRRVTDLQLCIEGTYLSSPRAEPAGPEGASGMTRVSASIRAGDFREPDLPGMDSFNAFSKVSNLFLSQSTSSKAPGSNENCETGRGHLWPTRLL